MIKNLVGILLIFTFVLSCGGIQKVAVKTTASIIYDASFEVEMETNWENFRYGVMSNLKLMEGFLYVDKENGNLLVSLLKGYAGYAFAISETLHMEEVFLDKEDQFHKYQAISNYERALNYGLRFFKLQGLTEEMLSSTVGDEKKFQELLSDSFDSDDKNYQAVLFTAQALGGLINLQKSRMDLVAQLPIVKGLFDWVCERDPEISFGACQIFYGAYEAGRPRMLGGDPERGRKIFLESIKKYPENWLMRVSYLQFYIIPMLEEDDFKSEMQALEELKEKFNSSQRWRPGQKDEMSDTDKRIHFYQALAIKRYSIIKKYEKEIF